MDNVDGNLEALRIHEQEIDEIEKRHEAFTEELEQCIGNMIDDCEYIFNNIADKYGFDQSEFIDYLKYR